MPLIYSAIKTIYVFYPRFSQSNVCDIYNKFTCRTKKTNCNLQPTTQPPVIGGDPCTWGPSFWCSSVEHAQQCGMTVSFYLLKKNYNKLFGLLFLFIFKRKKGVPSTEEFKKTRLLPLLGAIHVLTVLRIGVKM